MKFFPVKYLAAIGLLAALPFLQGCEKKPPTFVPREAQGKEAVVHFDDMKSEPKYVHVKKKDRFSREAIERRRESRERARGIFRKQSRWDY